MLTFSNLKPNPLRADIQRLDSAQKGSIGDLTASRKVRVWDIPEEEASEMVRRKGKPPERIANCLYLEWFSEANGRVVIESPDYELTLSAPEWRLTPEEEQERAGQAADGMSGFMGKLTKAIEEHQQGAKSPEEPWDEFDYEKFLKEADARNEKHRELLDKYGHSEEAQGKIDQEMGWAREMTGEEAMRQQAWIEDSLKFQQAIDEMGLKDEEEEELDDFLFELHLTSAKLAGALGSIAHGGCAIEPGFTIAYLKRALDHLHRSQGGVETAATKKLLPGELVEEARKELFAIRQGILNLMEQYRRQV